jgi:hypothetical protein
MSILAQIASDDVLDSAYERLSRRRTAVFGQPTSGHSAASWPRGSSPVSADFAGALYRIWYDGK